MIKIFNKKIFGIDISDRTMVWVELAKNGRSLDICQAEINLPDKSVISGRIINKDELLTDEINSLITLSKNNNAQFALVYFTLNNLQEITDNSNNQNIITSFCLPNSLESKLLMKKSKLLHQEERLINF